MGPGYENMVKQYTYHLNLRMYPEQLNCFINVFGTLIPSIIVTNNMFINWSFISKLYLLQNKT